MFKRINLKYDKVFKVFSVRKYNSIKCGFFTYGIGFNDIIETVCLNIVLNRMKTIKLTYYSLDMNDGDRNFMEDSNRLVSNDVKDIRYADVNKLDVTIIYIVYCDTRGTYI
jgi:hypothetical protein